MAVSGRLEVFLSILAYSACSGTLLLVNKLILSQFPYPSLVITVQLLASVAIIWGGAALNIIDVDPLECRYIVPYLNYTILFGLGVYCNSKTLTTANLETVIVFRALAPCIVSILDYLYLEREIPSKQSTFALSLIVLGAYGYAITDPKYKADGAVGAYLWPSLYTIVISLVMAYGKKILKDVNLKTQSGPVLYTNILGWPPMLIFAVFGNEFNDLELKMKEPGFPSYSTMFFMVLGCIIGTAIGYSSWWCRDKVSATSFTLIGVMNKCLTVFLNLIIWDQHANAYGILSLSLCLIGGSLYRQAPVRKPKGNSGGTEPKDSDTEPANGNSKGAGSV